MPLRIQTFLDALRSATVILCLNWDDNELSRGEQHFLVLKHSRG